MTTSKSVTSLQCWVALLLKVSHCVTATAKLCYSVNEENTFRLPKMNDKIKILYFLILLSKHTHTHTLICAPTEYTHQSKTHQNCLGQSFHFSKKCHLRENKSLTQ